MEPLRATLPPGGSHGLLVLQAHGSTRLLLLPPDGALAGGLAPFPALHPYAGSSQPALAATSRPPWPSSHPHARKPPPAQSPASAKSQQGGVPAPAAQAPAPALTCLADDGLPEPQSDGLPALSLSAVAAGSCPPPSDLYLHEGELMRQAVEELWPAFGGLRGGHALLLHPGDAVFIPTGWWVHHESLYTLAPPQAAAALPASALSGGSSAACGAAGARPLPGNVTWEVEVCLGRGGTAPPPPLALGALQLQAAGLVERWATQASGSAARARALLLTMADHLDPPTPPAPTHPRGPSGGDATPQQRPGTLPGAEAPGESGDTSPPCSAATRPWATFPSAGAAADGGAGEALCASSFFTRRHWACPEEDGLPSPFALSCQGYAPAWDVRSLAGQQHVALTCQVLELLAPLTALASVAHAARPRAAAPPPADLRGAAGFLRAMCAGRLLPTPWLNKVGEEPSRELCTAELARVADACTRPAARASQLAHNDAMLLKDAPWRFAIEMDEEEADFPELFQPQLERREARARAAAEAKHLLALKAAAAAESAQSALPAAPDASALPRILAGPP